MTRIALFGTSADPPHRGHAAILTWAATQFDHVAVWTANNPFKAHQAPLSDRFRMLALLIDELDVPPGRVQIHPELSHLRSIISIERAQERWPGAQFSLVVGSDLLEQLPTWYRAQDIFATVDILVVPRPGYAITEAGLSLLTPHTQVTIADIPQQVDVASSDYRQADTESALTPAVQTYIAQHHLYPCPEDSRKTLITP
ncbi:MAG: nicotinate-nucleotide adenylyltransferase [Leptolyngbyaceae cyanobacterium SM2_5_2]|nr:nicotinate-nucleotide adenylyltransferase [Leptolyngbyaceae cyanobacterium SM2_5_2]